MTRFAARVLGDKDRQEWQALWERSPRWLAHRWEYLDAAATGVGRPVRLGIFSAAGQLAAGLVFVERPVRFLSAWRHPAPAPFAGLMAEDRALSESTVRDWLGAAAEQIARETAMAEIVFQPSMQDVRGLLWNGWEAKPYYNYTNSIDRDEALREGAENSARRQGKKAESAGIVVSLGGDELWPGLEELNGAMRERNGLKPYVAPECFRQLSKWLRSEDAPECHFACVASALDPTGVAQAAGFFAGDSHRVYYLLGGSPDTDEGQGTGAPTLLHFAVTESIHRQRQEPFVYDWVGANTASVSRFKKNFRPQLEVCQRTLWRRGLAKWAGGI